MTDFFEKHGYKWLVLLYGAYLVNRAVNAIFDPQSAAMIFGSSEQFIVNGMRFDYLPGTILHPLAFTIITTELSRQRLVSVAFYGVLGTHLFSVFFASYTILSSAPEGFWHSLKLVFPPVGASDSVYCAANYDPSDDACLKQLINNGAIFAALVFTPIAISICAYLQRKQIHLFETA